MDSVNIGHLANEMILAYLKEQEPAAKPFQKWDAIDDWHLGTHPDLVMYFWEMMTSKLPFQCKCIVYRRPALVHPETGVIFGMAGGTDTIALRLPTPEQDEALKIKGFGKKVKYPLKGTVYANKLGEDWALVPPFDDRLRDWCFKAYEYAGTLNS
jgi:hypothetical protein